MGLYLWIYRQSHCQVLANIGTGDKALLRHPLWLTCMQLFPMLLCTHWAYSRWLGPTVKDLLLFQLSIHGLMHT